MVSGVKMEGLYSLKVNRIKITTEFGLNLPPKFVGAEFFIFAYFAAPHSHELVIGRVQLGFHFVGKKQT